VKKIKILNIRKLKLVWLMLFVFGALVLLSGIYAYLAFQSHSYTHNYNPGAEQGTTQDSSAQPQSPSSGTSTSSGSGSSPQDIRYMIGSMAVKLGISSLHNPPFSGDTPRVQTYVSDSPYAIEVKGGQVYVGQGTIQNPDIIIRTDANEIAKVISDSSYIKTSINAGKTSVEIKASYTTLFLKGYLGIYDKLK
jgi:hypothetical protein